MRFLVVGLGSAGQRHVRNLRQLMGREAELQACRVRGLMRALTVDGKVQEGESVEQLHGIRTFKDLDEALGQLPAAVLVCNPTSLHIPVALAAARMGCHLFIEKPVSNSFDGLERLASIVQEKRLQVLVGFQFRFHPGLAAARRLIAGNAIGAIVHAHAHWGEYLPEWHPWEDYRESYSARFDLGGGVIHSLCHPFDYLRWILGEIRTVSATSAKLSDLELDVEDTADITLTLESGAICTVHLDFIQRPKSHSLHIIGKEGTITWDNDGGSLRWYQGARKEWEEIPAPPGFDRNTMFLDEMRHFVDCVAGRAEPYVGLAEGIRAVEIALAAKRSAAERRAIEV